MASSTSSLYSFSSQLICLKSFQHISFGQPPNSSVYKTIQHLPNGQTPNSFVSKAIQQSLFGQLPNPRLKGPAPFHLDSYQLMPPRPSSTSHLESLPIHSSTAIRTLLIGQPPNTYLLGFSIIRMFAFKLPAALPIILGIFLTSTSVNAIFFQMIITITITNLLPWQLMQTLQRVYWTLYLVCILESRIHTEPVAAMLGICIAMHTQHELYIAILWPGYYSK